MLSGNKVLLFPTWFVSASVDTVRERRFPPFI
jgi:hypothetical protein